MASHTRPRPTQSRHAGNRYGLAVIAASLGGVEAIGDVLSALPADFPIPIAVVLHRSATAPSSLSQVLGRRTRLIVKDAEQSETIRPASSIWHQPIAT